MAGLREQKKQETRLAIQAAAVKLFTEKSFEKTTIEDISREAGIGKTTVYGYFSTKDDIFIDYCDELLDQAFAGIRMFENEDKKLIDRLIDFFMIEFSFFTENHEFGRQLLREMVFPSRINKKAQAHNQRYFDVLEGLLRTAREKGEIAGEFELFHLAVHFFSLYLGILAGWYTGYLDSLKAAEEGMRNLFTQALEGISE